MTKFSHATILLLLLMACMMSGHSEVFALEPPQIRHLYLPTDKSMNFPAGDWKPIRYKTIQDALLAQQTVQAPETYLEQYLLNGRIEQKSGETMMTGEVKITAHNLSSQPAWLNLGMNQIIYSKMSSEGKPLLTGSNSLGENVMLIASGLQKITGHFSIPLKNNAQGFEVNMTLPASIKIQMKLELLPDQLLTSNIGRAIAGLYLANGMIPWSLDLGARQELNLKIIPSDKKLSQNLATSLLVDEQINWTIEPESSVLLAEFRPEILGRPTRQMTFETSPELFPLSVSTFGGMNLNYKYIDQNGARILTVDFPEELQGLAPPLRIRCQCATQARQIWTLPRLKLNLSQSIQSTLQLNIKEPLNLDQIIPQGYLQNGYQSSSRNLESLQFKVYEADPRMKLWVSVPNAQPTGATVNRITTRQGMLNLDACCMLSFDRPSSSLLTLTVPKSWILHDFSAKVLSGESNGVIGWRKKYEDDTQRHFEIQLQNPPSALAKILVQWNVEETNDLDRNYNSLISELPRLLALKKDSQYLLVKDFKNEISVSQPNGERLLPAVLPQNQWPASFAAMIKYDSSETVFHLSGNTSFQIQNMSADKAHQKPYISHEVQIGAEIVEEIRLPIHLLNPERELTFHQSPHARKMQWILKTPQEEIDLTDSSHSREIPATNATTSTTATGTSESGGTIWHIQLPEQENQSANQLIGIIIRDRTENFKLSKLTPLNHIQEIPGQIVISSPLNFEWKLSGKIKEISAGHVGLLQDQTETLTTTQQAPKPLLEYPDILSMWEVDIHLPQTVVEEELNTTQLQIITEIVRLYPSSLRHWFHYTDMNPEHAVKILQKMPGSYRLVEGRLNQITFPVGKLEKSLVSLSQNNDLKSSRLNLSLCVETDPQWLTWNSIETSVRPFLCPVSTWEWVVTIPNGFDEELVTANVTHRVNKEGEKTQVQRDFKVIRAEDHFTIHPLIQSQILEDTSPLQMALQDDMSVLGTDDNIQTASALTAYLEDQQSVNDSVTYRLVGQGNGLPNSLELRFVKSLLHVWFMWSMIACISIVILLVSWFNRSAGLVLTLTCLCAGLASAFISSQNNHDMSLLLLASGLIGMIWPFLRVIDSTISNDPEPASPSSLMNTVNYVQIPLLVLGLTIFLFVRGHATIIYAQDQFPTTGQVLPESDLSQQTVWEVLVTYTGEQPIPPQPDDLVYVRDQLFQLLQQTQSDVNQKNLVIYQEALYEPEFDQDGQLYIKTHLKLSCPDTLDEIEIPFSPKELTLAGLQGCKINGQPAVITNETKNGFKIKVPAPPAKTEINSTSKTDQEIKTEITPAVNEKVGPAASDMANRDSVQLRTGAYIIHQIQMDFYPHVNEQGELRGIEFQIPPIANARTRIPQKEAIFPFEILTFNGMVSTTTHPTKEVLLGLVSTWQMIQQPAIPSKPKALTLESQITSYWQLSPKYQKVMTLITLLGRIDDAKELTIKLPAYSQIRSVNSPRIGIWNVTQSQNGATLLKLNLKSSTAQTGEALKPTTLEIQYDLPVAVTNGILSLPTSIVVMDDLTEQVINPQFQHIGLLNTQGFQLKPAAIDPRGYASITRDTYFKSVFPDVIEPLAPETTASGTLKETWIKAPPDMTFRVLSGELLNVGLEPILPVNAFAIQQMIDITDDVPLWDCEIIPELESAYQYRYELLLDARIEIDSVEVKQSTQNLPARWSRLGERLTIFLGHTSDRPLPVTIHGKFPSLPHEGSMVIMPAFIDSGATLTKNSLTLKYPAQTMKIGKLVGIKKLNISATSGKQESFQIDPAMEDPLLELITLVPGDNSSGRTSSIQEASTSLADLKNAPYVAPMTPLLKSNCLWSHFLQVTISEEIMGVTSGFLESPLSSFKLKIPANMKVNTLVLNGTPQSEFLVENGMLIATLESQEIQTIDIAWTLPVLASSDNELNHLFLQSEQLENPDHTLFIQNSKQHPAVTESEQIQRLKQMDRWAMKTYEFLSRNQQIIEPMHTMFANNLRNIELISELIKQSTGNPLPPIVMDNQSLWMQTVMSDTTGKYSLAIATLTNEVQLNPDSTLPQVLTGFEQFTPKLMNMSARRNVSNLSTPLQLNVALFLSILPVFIMIIWKELIPQKALRSKRAVGIFTILGIFAFRHHPENVLTLCVMISLILIYRKVISLQKTETPQSVVTIPRRF
jgi:hypothetical protein